MGGSRRGGMGGRSWLSRGGQRRRGRSRPRAEDRPRARAVRPSPPDRDRSSIREMEMSSSRSSPRGVTRSSIPWSSRYSARWNPSGSFSRMVCSMTRGPAKQISAAGLGYLDIAEHRVAGRHPARGGMGEHDDIGQARLLEHLDRDSGAGHLHEREDPLLHPGAPGGGEEDQRAPELHRLLGGGDDGVAHVHPHGARHEGEILRPRPRWACARSRRWRRASPRPLLWPSVRRAGGPGYFFWSRKWSGVGDGFGHGDLAEDAAVEERRGTVRGETAACDGRSFRCRR